MQDIPIYKLIIIKRGHVSTQYKEIVDTLFLLYTDKNYQGIDHVIWTGNDLAEVDFMLPYLNTNQWSTVKTTVGRW